MESPSLAQLATYTFGVDMEACRSILARGREMQTSGKWISTGGDDVFNSWKKTLRWDELLPQAYPFRVYGWDTKDKSIEPVVPVAHAILIHGTPGWNENFRKMIPPLVSQNVRCVIPNMPGHGDTLDVPQFRQSNDERAEFIRDLISKLGMPRVDVLVGYSSACYVLLKLAADETYYDRTDTTSSPASKLMIWICPGGMIQPHQSIQPYRLTRIAARFQYSMVSPMIDWARNKILTRRGIKVAQAEQRMASDLFANVGFSQFPTYLKRVRDDPSTPRVLMIYSTDDAMVEKERSEETARALGIDRAFTIKSHDEIDKAQQHVRDWLRENSHRHAAIIFEKEMGGHDLPDKQATFLSSCVSAMIPEVD